MKLKKIASLALAGIMAVSMLTACGEGGKNEGNEGANSQLPATSAAVDYANQTLSAYAKDYMTYKSSNWLNDELKKVATDTSKFEADDIKKVFFNDPSLDTNKNNNDFNKDMAAKIADDMKAANKAEVYDYTENSNYFKNLPANGSSQTMVWVYTVSGAVNEKVAVNEAAGHFSRWMADQKYIGSTVPNASDYDAKFEVEISTIKVTNSSLTLDESAWVIAIAATQNVTKTASSQV